MKESRKNFEFSIKFILLVGFFFVQTFSKLVNDDPNLDDFSRALFNCADFDITQDNYKVESDQIVFEIQSLSEQVQQNVLKFRELTISKAEQVLTNYKNFKSIVFQNGPKSTLLFDGIYILGDQEKKISVQVLQLLYKDLFMLQFFNISSVFITKSSFSYSTWVQSQFTLFNNVKTIYIQTFQVNQSQFSSNYLMQVLNSYNTTIGFADLNQNNQNYIADVQNVNIFKILKMNIYKCQIKNAGQPLNQNIFNFNSVQQLSLYEMIITNNTIRTQNTFKFISIQGSDVVKINKSLIKFNNATNSYSSMEILKSVNIALVSVFVENNIQLGNFGGTMAIDSTGVENSLVTITDSVFKKNFAYTSGGAIYINAQFINIYHTKFVDNVSQGNGGALFVESTNTIDINNVLFQSNSAIQSGGAIFLSSNTLSNALKVFNATFKNNYVHYCNGGALFTNKFNSIQLEFADFDHNQAFEGDGGAIYGRNIETIFVRYVNFTKNQAFKGGSLRVDYSNLINIILSNFTKNFANNTGGACYFIQINYSSDFNGCNFKENQAIFGGALYLYENSAFQLTNSLFEKNQALQDGGAVFLSENTHVLEMVNTKFHFNIAQGIGGAIYAKQIKHSVDQSSIISNNSALIGGGLACSNISRYQDLSKIQIDEIVQDNNAQIYGNNIGLIPKSIFLTHISYYDEGSQQLKPLNFTKQIMLQQQEIQSFVVNDVKSPSNLVFFWKLVDENDQIIAPIKPTQNDITQIVSINNTPEIQERMTEYNLFQKQSFLQNYTIFSENEFSTIFFTIGEPSKDQQVQISFLSGIQGSAKVVNILFNYRKCQIGEVYIQSTFQLCQECRQGTYSFSDPYNASCFNQPEGVQKSFGSTLIMQPGYWRSSQYSATILECQFQGSCIGGEGYGNGLCQNGYQGVMCKQCAFNDNTKYTQNLFDLECTNCEEKQGQSIFQIVLLCIYLVAISFLVMNSLVQDFLLEKMSFTLTKMKVFLFDKRQSQRRLSVVYIKMFLHFCQISICLNFMQIQNANISSNLYVIPKYLTDTITVIIQLSTCFFVPNSGLNSSSVAFTQLILVEISPIIFFLFGYLLIYALHKVKKLDLQQKQYYSRNLFWFCFCSLFSISIIRYLVSISACTQVGDQNRMFADYNIQCDNNTTRIVLIYSLILPIFAFFCAYLPLTLIQILTRQSNIHRPVRKSVELQDTQKQLSNTENQTNQEKINILSDGSTLQLSKNSDNYLYRINGSDRFSKSNYTDNSASQLPYDERQDNIIQMEYDVEDQVINYVREKSCSHNGDLKKPLFGKKIEGKLTEKSLNQINYWYLTVGYKPEYQYWEIVKFIFRQVIIIMIFFSNEIPIFAGSLSIVFYIFYFYFLSKKQPFVTKQLNNLENECHLIQAGCLFSFLIIQQINGDYRFEYMTYIFVFFAYFVFFWFLFKMLFLIVVSLMENNSKIDNVKMAFNLVIPNTYKINNEKSQKKWMLIQNNLKLILSRGLDDKLLDRQFLIHQNKNLLRSMKNKRDSNEEVIDLDKQS
ncbi:transmembrane protein, putative (macronuclear) [Tetrahymena thermophila SB210]|uniref:Transmembrane protein, putative n=1 Tax=Tetrahymena thermophila (strain SB210) TaxID=312017 RepID=W7XCX3_TETTS|nr:transmembrane protein, putative [Tetrahymena thermophila SB210]EWS74433.1 transmembrane protein, putative [Tetrahymena thermophila SB210]|eukprot:XP_012653010.1 transmembrane protein, putative [Tetrahymena thermophila SB210]